MSHFAYLIIKYLEIKKNAYHICRIACETVEYLSWQPHTGVISLLYPDTLLVENPSGWRTCVCVYSSSESIGVTLLPKTTRFRHLMCEKLMSAKKLQNLSSHLSSTTFLTEHRCGFFSPWCLFFFMVLKSSRNEPLWDSLGVNIVFGVFRLFFFPPCFWVVYVQIMYLIFLHNNRFGWVTMLWFLTHSFANCII